jgi:hypothetical protein
MDGLTIGEVAAQARVHIETLRYYERRGLIERPPRSVSNYRRYPEDAVRRVHFIKRAQELGFSLYEKSGRCTSGQGPGHSLSSRSSHQWHTRGLLCRARSRRADAQGCWTRAAITVRAAYCERLEHQSSPRH